MNTKVRGMKLRLAKSTGFLSPQGEGSELGVPMWFIRLAGCSVASCPLHPATGNTCDTDWSFSSERTVGEVFGEVPAKVHWLCITGGEPTDQLPAVERLVECAHRRNMRVNLQTSGVREVPEMFDWLTVSPKCGNVTELVQRHGNELKLVYQGQDILRLRAWVWQSRFHRYYLQPHWLPDGTSNIADVARVCCEAAREGLPWRMGIQAHKYAGVA